MTKDSAIRSPILWILPSPSQSDDTGCDEFLNLGPDMDVLHVFLKGSWVPLGLLKNGLHDRILEDGHDLGGDAR
jgi:hypothetical protein